MSTTKLKQVDRGTFNGNHSQRDFIDGMRWDDPVLWVSARQSLTHHISILRNKIANSKNTREIAKLKNEESLACNEMKKFDNTHGLAKKNLVNKIFGTYAQENREYNNKELSKEHV